MKFCTLPCTKVTVGDNDIDESRGVVMAAKSSRYQSIALWHRFFQRMNFWRRTRPGGLDAAPQFAP